MTARYGNVHSVRPASANWRPSDFSGGVQMHGPRPFPGFADQLPPASPTARAARATASTNSVQKPVGSGASIQPPSSSSSSAGGTRLRRRLSKIFHQPSAVSVLGRRLSGRPEHARQEPAGNLPVAPDPAMAAAHFGGETRGVVLVQLHVGDQRRAGIAAFHQIVTQDEILREAPGRGLPERVHVVDAFADVGPLGKQVLIHVGHLARVGIDPRFAGTELGKPRAIGREQADGRARLQNGVALDHAAGRRIEPRPVQRMRHRADEFAGGIARQAGIGVQREDVSDGGEDRQIADDLGKRLARTAAQQRVELLQLAAFAFVAHPEALVRIPDARPMEQMEDGHALGAVPRIQGLDAVARQPQQVRVVGLRRLGRIAEVGEQREQQVRVAVPQVADLQAFQQIGDGLRTGQERGDDHHRAVVRRDPFREIQARQQARADHDIRQQVHQRDRHLRRGDDSQHHQQPEPPVLPAQQA